MRRGGQVRSMHDQRAETQCNYKPALLSARTWLAKKRKQTGWLQAHVCGQDSQGPHSRWSGWQL